MESLPGTFCATGDCSYTQTEHLVPVFRGVNATPPINDNFNYYASQLRICIEMAFGLMVNKWGVLHRPLSFKLENLHKLVVAIGILHKFCINERLSTNNQTPFDPKEAEFDANIRSYAKQLPCML
jgi:DDE superfamily endonuclease